MQTCVKGVRGRAHAEHKQGSLVDFWRGIVLFCFLRRKKKKGGFRGGVDECVDGGILIGVILT